MDQDGVEVRPLRQATGDARFNEVFLTDAKVPQANMLGELNNGWWVLQNALAYERAAMGSPMRRGRDQSAKESVRTADSEKGAPNPDLSLIDLAKARGVADDPEIRQRLMALRELVLVNEWNGQRAKAEMKAGSSSSIMSLGKLAMSRILHTAGSLQGSILGAETMLGGRQLTRRCRCHVLDVERLLHIDRWWHRPDPTQHHRRACARAAERARSRQGRRLQGRPKELIVSLDVTISVDGRKKCRPTTTHRVP